MQGLPKRTSGVIVMRSKELMRQVYGNHLADRKMWCRFVLSIRRPNARVRTAVKRSYAEGRMTASGAGSFAASRYNTSTSEPISGKRKYPNSKTSPALAS